MDQDADLYSLVLLEILWFTFDCPIDLIECEVCIVRLVLGTLLDVARPDVHCLLMVDVVDNSDRVLQRTFLKNPITGHEEAIG